MWFIDSGFVFVFICKSCNKVKQIPIYDDEDDDNDDDDDEQNNNLQQHQ